MSRQSSDRGASEHWSDGETAALVQAWGQLYLQRNRLRDAEWREVCGAVNAHRAAAGRHLYRTVARCQWRIYSLKSQYKKEVKEEEVVGLVEGRAHGVESAECLPAGAVATRLAELHWSLEMERLGVEKQRMAMEWEMRAAKVEAENEDN